MKRLAPAVLLALAACTTATQTRRPPHVAAPAPVPTIVPPPARILDWRDQPLTPGTWRYTPDLAVASYGAEGQPPVVLVRCDKTARRVILSLPGRAAGPVMLRTSYAEQSVTATAGTGGAELSFAATDSLLDRVAFSRGRFSLAQAGAPLILLPAWAEPARVIEDCRG